MNQVDWVLFTHAICIARFVHTTLGVFIPTFWGPFVCMHSTVPNNDHLLINVLYSQFFPTANY